MPSPLTVDQPFPTAEGICPDAYSLKIISPAYATSAGELNAVMQYIYQTYFFERQGYKDYALTIERIAIAEMVHLKLLGSTILALGAAPVYTANPPAMFNFYSAKFVTYSRTLVCMLEDDIRAEKGAIRSYTHMLSMLKNECVKDIIARILEDEKLHLKVFEEILSSIKC